MARREAQIRRGKAGVSNVVSALILTSIVTVSGAAIVFYGLNSLSQTTQFFALVSETSRDQARERFVVDDVFFNGTSQMGVSVFNVGKRTVTVDLLIINDTVVDLIGTDQLSLEPGERGNILVSISVEAGKLYVLRVVSTRGVVYESLWKT